MTETKEMTTADNFRNGNTEFTPVNQASGVSPAKETSAALFADNEAQTFRSKWSDIQSEFVDEPRKSVEKADHLVAETIKRLADIFSGERDKLEHEWSRGGDDSVSTEDLRQALRRYRSFFDRLLSV